MTAARVMGLSALLITLGAGVAQARPSAVRHGSRATSAASTVSPWQPLPLQQWLGPIAASSRRRALKGLAVGGRDGAVRWRALPPELLREAVLGEGLRREGRLRPIRLHALIERAGSGAVVVKTRLCLPHAGRIRLRVVSAAALWLAIDDAEVMRLATWPGARPNLRAAAHELSHTLTAGCHTVSAVIGAPSGRLTLGLAWLFADARSAPAGTLEEELRDLLIAAKRPESQSIRGKHALSKKRAALTSLVAIIGRGGARGPQHSAVLAAIAAGHSSHPGAARLHGLAASESGDRIAALRRAGRRWPKDEGLALALMAQLDEVGKSHEALKIWQARLPGAQRRSATACAAHALLWQRLDVPRAARALAEACAARFPKAVAGLEIVAQLAAAREDLVAAARARYALSRLAPNNPERWLDLLSAYAELAEDTPLSTTTRAHLKRTLSEAPATAAAWDRARARNILGLAWLQRAEPRRAAEILRGIPPWARRAFSLELLGRALLAQSSTEAQPGPGLKSQHSSTAPQRRAEAIALLHEALRRAPGRSHVRARLALLAPGRTFYRRHERHLQRLAHDAAARAIPAVAFTQLLRQTVVRQLAPGRLARYEVAMWQIGKNGPRSHDVEIDYVPGQTTPEILQAAIVHRNGQTVRSVPQQLQSISEGDTGLYYDLEQITLSYTNLRAGDVIVVAYTLRDFAPDPFGLVFGELFQLGDAWPVVETDIVLELDPTVKPVSALTRPQSVVNQPHSKTALPQSKIETVDRRHAAKTPQNRAISQRNVLTDGGLIGAENGGERQGRQWRQWRFQVKNLAAVAVEEQMPGAAEVVATLHVSSFRSWTAAAQWYGKWVADALPKPGTNPAITQLSQRLIRGLSSPKAKANAIYRWVADEVRYVGLEFGIHSLKPHAVGDVLARRFGDCKDKSTLLVALLAEVGIEAHVALVRTADSGKLRDGVASLGGFSHAITRLPKLNWWLDTTLQYHQPTELPAGDVGGQALVISRDQRQQSGLVDLPDAGASANTRVERGLIELLADGGAKLSLTIRATGLPAASLRERLHAPMQRQERIQADLAGRYPGLQVHTFSLAGVRPMADEVVLQIEATVPALSRKNAGSWTWQPLAPQTPWRKQASAAATRSHPYVGAYAWRDERHLVIAPPRGWRLHATPRQAFWVGGLGSFKLDVSADQAGRWRLSRTILRGRRVLPATGHAGLVRWLARVDAALELEVRLSPATKQVGP